FSKRCSIPPKNELLSTCESLPKREYSQGTIVNDTRNESNVETSPGTQNWRKISETKPEDIAIGKNTTTITHVIADTVNPISLAPSKDARTLSLPISIWRWIFSITTSASSTKIPTTNDSPKSDIRFSVYPNIFKKIKVAINDNGIAITAINASRKLCRKNNMMNATNAMAIIRSCITLFAAVNV